MNSIPVLYQELKEQLFQEYGTCWIILNCKNAKALQEHLRNHELDCQLAQLKINYRSKLLLYYKSEGQKSFRFIKRLIKKFDGNIMGIWVTHSLKLQITNLWQIRKIVAQLEKYLKSLEFKMKRFWVWEVDGEYYIKSRHLQLIFINDWIHCNKDMQLRFQRPWDCKKRQDWIQLGIPLFHSEDCLKQESSVTLVVYESKTKPSVYQLKKQNFIEPEQRENSDRWTKFLKR